MQGEPQSLPDSFYRELNRELTNILGYWITHTMDLQWGGYYGKIDNDDIIDTKAPKGLVLNARILWSFSATGLHTGDTMYHYPATRVFQYLKEYFWDEAFGGFFWSLDYTGKPLLTRKQIYGQAFAIYGLSEYYRLTGDAEALKMAQDTFQLIEDKSLDTRYGGYLEALAQNWTTLDDLRLSEKDANEKKSMNTHLHVLEAYTNLYRCVQDPHLKKQCEGLLHIFHRYIVDPTTGSQHLFFEEDWSVKSHIASFGHDIEASWLLWETATLLNDPKWLEAIKPLSLRLAESSLRGLAPDGSLWNEQHLDTKKIDTNRHWWVQAEGMVGFLHAYQLTGEAVWKNRALTIWDFIKSRLITESGEWYWGVDDTYTPMQDQDKAGFWKCPYHNTRACIEAIGRKMKNEE